MEETGRSDLGVPMLRRRRIAKSFDTFPTTERPNDHVRQIHPGNHRIKLRKGTISELNKVFADAMKFFGYV
jgi:hypothetical protein